MLNHFFLFRYLQCWGKLGSADCCTAAAAAQKSADRERESGHATTAAAADAHAAAAAESVAARGNWLVQWVGEGRFQAKAHLGPAARRAVYFPPVLACGSCSKKKACQAGQCKEARKAEGQACKPAARAVAVAASAIAPAAITPSCKLQQPIQAAKAAPTIVTATATSGYHRAPACDNSRVPCPLQGNSFHSECGPPGNQGSVN